ncbi:hypothetical protein KSC_063340 [Ktedonobacter sp. SOSP1-52]|uniref:tetratricopeptide repeat protein n=1 Tax=Ktedonobacter sp. SOSP1-52 TaxID=2778366 RepID=UPI001915434F|nr:tetratricopeptide repeat protein [Ktedonobacter sp. SOSP1-52]GHO67442.1 hypothetical protein KSC_063340 [Ktedonobacter sp. SOSP1-52]
MREEFLELRLEGEPASGEYRLISGPTTYTITFNPEANFAFSDGLRHLERVLVGEEARADLLRDLGSWLWRALLPESAPQQEREVLVQALRSAHTTLLLTLPETLARLPWELLYNPEQTGKSGFLALRRPLIRRSSSEATVDMLKPPLRVLLLVSSPPGLGDDSRVDVESERAAVEQAVREAREAGYLHLLVEDIVTPQRVQRHLVRFKPHIVHYIGHGVYSESSGGLLLWEDEQGNESPISAERFADLLRPRNLCAVVLHACQTGKSHARAEMRGIAEALITEGIPAVLSQQSSLTYESSQHASEAWYTALTAGQSFAEALFEVRQALSQAERPDWAVPILQGTRGCLTPLLDDAAAPGPTDPLLTSTGAASDVPTPTGVFVGRHRELRELRLMLESAPGSGPVMALITGPGGVGKSTLAAQAITRYGGTYKAALTLHCQGYQSIDLFLQRMGEFFKRLGVPGFLEQCLPDPKLSTEAKIEEAIAALNAAGPLLLVIDNLESVQSDDQAISDPMLLYLLRKLLTNLRSGRVLVTDRYAIKNLLPQGKFAANLRHLDLDDLSRYETNQLLLRHPALAQLGETVRATLLDEFGGLPYVYDLLSSSAASQSLDLLIQDVQGRITQARKQRSAQEWQAVRQQVIEFAALDATVQRLSEPSRTLLAQLSVLQRPLPLLAIEDSLSAPRSAWQPLLDWSLLRYDTYEQKYHLHSLTRRYAEDFLEEQSRKQTQAQLAIWYENYADRESNALPDYLEAHRLLRAAGKVYEAGELVSKLSGQLRRFGLYPLLHTLSIVTLDDIQNDYEQLQASMLHILGILSYVQGEYKEARGFYRKSLDITEQLRDQRGRAANLYQLGVLAKDQGMHEEARRLCDESLEIAKELKDWKGQAVALYQLGVLAQDQGEYEEARRLYGESLEIKERLGDQEGRAYVLYQLGIMVKNQGKYEEARRLYSESLEIFSQLGDQRGQANILYQLAMISKNQGKYEKARRLYGESLEIKAQLGDQVGQANILQQLGIIAQNQGEYEEARKLYNKSLEIAERLGNQDARFNSLGQLGTLAQLQGEYEKAQKLYRESLEIVERLGDRRARAVILHDLGNVSHLQGEYKEAQRLYEESLEVFNQLEYQDGRASSLGQLGVLAYEQEDYKNALTYMIQSYIIFTDLGSPKRTSVQKTIAKIRYHMDEEEFRTHWQALTVDQPLSDIDEEETTENDEDIVLTLEELPSYVASFISQGTDEQQQQLATNLFEAQQQLSPEDAPEALFLRYLVAALRGKIPEAEKLEAPFTELWQQLEEMLNTASVEASKHEEEKHNEAD